MNGINTTLSAFKQEIHSDLPIPPREYLEEVLTELHITNPELWNIIADEEVITPHIAVQLQGATGVPAHIWIGLEEEYQLILCRSAGNLPGTCRQVDASRRKPDANAT